MCLVGLAFKVHPKYPILLITNRDEAYARPTAQAHFWEDDPSILAGKDLEAGGTWMGVSKNGRFAALTNFRNPMMLGDDKKSRGELVTNYLKSSLGPKEWLKSIVNTASDYNPFNILVGNVEELFFMSSAYNQLTEVKPGVHGLSNDSLNTSWPKVTYLTKKLSTLIKTKKTSNTELFRALQNKKKAPVSKLPETGVGLALEKILSPAFIETENYGTRCSTILKISNEGEIHFSEKSHLLKENKLVEVKFFSE